MVAFRQHDIEDRLNAPLAAIRGFLGRSQYLVIKDEYIASDAFFVGKVKELGTIIATMPETYGARKGDPIAYLHYFHGASHFYITEKDAGAPDDEPEDFQSQAFGLICCPPSYPEMHYVCIPQLLASGAELDLHWTPKPISKIPRD